MGIGVAENGDVGIADGSDDQLLFFPNGSIKDGKIVKVEGLKSPFDVVIDPQNRVWVSNSQSDTVVRFPADDPSKVETFHAGLVVRALALDSKANVWVASNVSRDFPVPKVPKGASIMLQFELTGVAAYAYPKSTGVINMIRPDGVQPSPDGFTGGGAVDIPWGLNLDGNDDVWAGNIGPVTNGVVLLAGADTKGHPAGTKTGDLIHLFPQRQHSAFDRRVDRPGRRRLGREQLEPSQGGDGEQFRSALLDLGRRLGPHSHLRSSGPGEAAAYRDREGVLRSLPIGASQCVEAPPPTKGEKADERDDRCIETQIRRSANNLPARRRAGVCPTSPDSADAAEVPGPAGGPMTKAYVQEVARMAHVWGWPLVYVHNQRNTLTKAPEPILLNDAIPLAPMNQVSMLTGYVNPAETYIADPNQDVVYGLGYLSFEKEPVVIQVPNFGDRFWTIPVYDARTDQISQLGLQYGTKPGFYLIVGPNWRGETPADISGVVRSSTNFAALMPRIFMNDTPEDHAAIQPPNRRPISLVLRDA